MPANLQSASNDFLKFEGIIGDFEREEVDVIFNRDILISESEVIDNINKSQDLSLETRLAQHPWVDDVQAELDRINKENQESIEQYGDAFTPAINKTNPGKEIIDGEE